MLGSHARPLASALVVSGATTVIVVALLDVAYLPPAYLDRPTWLIRILGQAVWASLPLLAGPVAATGLLNLGRTATTTARRTALLALAPLAMAAHPWLLASQSQYVPTRVYILVAGALVFAAAAALSPRDPPRLRRGLTAIGVAGFLWLHVTNETSYVRLYEPVHILLLQAEALVLASALVEPARQLFTRAPRARSHASALSLGALVIGAGGGALGTGESHMRAHTLIGRGANVARPYTHERERAGEPARPDRDALSRFSRHSALPKLDVDLSELDILFITIEAVRFDATSFGSPQGTTPHLAALGAGGWVFSNAHSPSTGTLAATASLMTLVPPSASGVTTWQKSWHGRLSDRDTTVAEVLGEAGWHTFWAGHNYKDCFSIDMLGLDQGFSETRLVSSNADGHDADMDERIAREAIAAMDAAADRKRRAFGWVFFASPHAPYDARGDTSVDASNWVRYLSEVAHVDRQLGVLMSALRDRNRLDRTVVVVTADHGEEFGDHRGQNHKSSVHTELRHVPLVIHIPGAEPRVISRPTSTGYVLLWLMLHGPPGVRAYAERILTNVVGPYLRATEGAVIVELLGHERMETALVDSRHSIIIDWVAGHLSLFDLQTDPGEHEDLWLDYPDAFPELRARADAYARTRRALRRYRVTPEVRSPR